ncbi:gamma-aminobutyric acid receptor subunit beta-like isoform X1 [Neodiprion virginianus]|uniref:gamma-aminobutyric acid receptor subunit beta-like isoform X1 n=1 Tax=Neodiprion virginianus TaxID=2961670 RepID=UPI001EE747A0|nr:gamma-aminobutyric acid receptor subunit beta-like isoform X1 [Neodiprion virginianus]
MFERQPYSCGTRRTHSEHLRFILRLYLSDEMFTKHHALLIFLLLYLEHRRVWSTGESSETTTDTRISDRLENVTQTISRILEGYDIRLRPNFGGEPLLVGMDLTIASFDAISEVNMDYTITMYLNQYWKDERLAFSHEEEILTLSGDFAEKIWVPDTFFANDKNSFLHDVTERNKLVRLSGDGSVTYGMRFTTTLACMMDLHYYPLDSQNCTVEIESYGYTVLDVVMYWKETPVRGVEEAELPQFTIIGYETNDRKERLATGIYQRLSLSFKLQRNIGYFVFQTYLPSILIVMLSWVSFWINHEATSARVALGITTVLTMTTISTGVRSSLPRISYVKAIDIYLVMCFVFVFAALLEYAAVNYTYWGARAKKKTKKKEGTEKKSVTTAKTGGEASSPFAESTDADIIELQDLRMSPLPSIRSRSGIVAAPDGAGVPVRDHDPAKFPPSFRISRPPGYNTHCRTSGLRYRGARQHKPKVLHALRRGASVLRASMPKIKDVNIIDKYSRIVFPVSFLLFNAVYWIFYIL